MKRRSGLNNDDIRILIALSEGSAHEEIASALNLHTGTLTMRINRLRWRYGAHTTAHLVAKWIKGELQSP